VRNLRGKTRLVFWFLILAAVVLPGCQQTINYPSPRIATLSPASISAAQPSFTLTVTGYNFTPASTIHWNSGALATIFVNTNTLTTQVPAPLIQNAGSSNITVTTPTPGGGTTQILTFVVNPTSSPVPQISSTSPMTVVAGSGSFTLTVMGANFETLSVVNLGNVALQTTYISSTFLEVSVPANNVRSAGTLQLTVVNPASPAPSGGSSNVYAFNVNNPLPGILSVSPTALAAGGTTTSVSVTGTGFVPNSVVLINGAARTTSATDPTAVSVTLTAGDLAAGGIDQVQVMNPGPGGGTSNAAIFAIDPSTTAGLPVLVDYAFDGTQANAGICGGSTNCQSGGLGLALGTSGPSVSTTGEFVVFASVSNNLILNQLNGGSQIFVRDTCLGETCTPTTFVVSVAATGGPANGASSEPSVDSAADHAAYTSLATNIINYAPVRSGVRQVYWQPVCTTGATTTTGTTGATTLTACSASTTTTAGTTSVGGGVLVSLGADGNPGNADSYNPVISPDGQFVAFVSLATNLVSGVTVDGVTPQVYLRSVCDGATPLSQSTPGATSTCTPTTYLASSWNGIEPGNAPSSHPAIGDTGTFVSFVSTASNLLAANSFNDPRNQYQEIFEQDECQLVTSGCVPTMLLISTPDGSSLANGTNSGPTISYDGRFVAFASTGTNLVSGPTALFQQIYVRDTCTGTTTTCTVSTKLVSTLDGITPANGLSESPSINLDSTGSGQFIAFASNASDLSTNAANGIENIYVRNTCNTLISTTTACVANTVLVSHAAGSAPPAANGSSYAPSISADGTTVSFISFAGNLAPRDTNALEDIFLAATSF
jgi:WD40-like Beta Propeller Repeat